MEKLANVANYNHLRKDPVSFAISIHNYVIIKLNMRVLTPYGPGEMQHLFHQKTYSISRQCCLI